MLGYLHCLRRCFYFLPNRRIIFFKNSIFCVFICFVITNFVYYCLQCFVKYYHFRHPVLRKYGHCALFVIQSLTKNNELFCFTTYYTKTFKHNTLFCGTDQPLYTSIVCIIENNLYLINNTNIKHSELKHVFVFFLWPVCKSDTII